MIEKTGTVIMIVSEGVRIWREEHALLVRNGYSVVEAQYGEDALLKVRDGCPDLIVLDLDMAAGDGLMYAARFGARRARRANSTGKSEMPFTFESGDLKIDFDRRTVVVRGKKVRLTPKEWEVLQLLVTNQGKPIRHQMMLQSIWGSAYGRETQYLRVFIRQLRRKIESNPSRPELICTEPWLGYRFETPTA